MSERIYKAHGSGVMKYLVGFILSVALTLAAFWPVMNGYLVSWSISAKVLYLLGLALVQMMVQIAFFLHLTDGPDAKYNVITMWSAVVCVFIIIAGTWWTMWHLNYQVMGGAGRVEQIDMIAPVSERTETVSEVLKDNAVVHENSVNSAEVHDNTETPAVGTAVESAVQDTAEEIAQ